MTPEQEEIKRELNTRNVSKVDNWLTSEGLALLEGLSRDGYGYQDIAQRVGVAKSTLLRWARKYEAIDEALRRGREISDYMVENALFKSALGYRTKEVNIKTKMENGVITEVTKDVSFRDQNPNIRAIEVWLYNRKPELWRRDGGNRLDELMEDSSIQITVNRGLPKEDNEEKDNNEWPEEINKDITINKPTNNQTNTESKETSKANDKEKTKQKQSRKSGFDEHNKKRKIRNAMPSENINRDKDKALENAFININNSQYPTSEEKEDVNTQQEDLDEWPDDWEELIDINTLEEGE